MKKLLGILILLTIVKVDNISAQPLHPSFEDDHFYSCIIDNLNEQNINNQNNRVAETYTATDEELMKLTNVTCISYNIESTKGIEKLIGSSYFDFENNSFSSIDLSNNKAVTYLYVDKDVEVLGYDGTIEREVEIVDSNPVISTTILITGIVGIIIYLIFSIELTLIFSKLGEKGWKAWIPILNQIVLLKITGLPIWYIILLCIPPFNIFVMYKIGVQLCIEFNRSKIVTIFFILLPPIGLLLFLITKKDRSVTNARNVQNIENNIPNITVQNQPLGYGSNMSSSMMAPPIPSNNGVNMGVPEINPVTNSMGNPIPDTMMSQPNSNPNEMPPNNGVNIGIPEINPVTNSMENPIPDTMMSQPNSNPNEMPPNNGVNMGVPEINPVTNSMENPIPNTMMSQPNSNPNEMSSNNGMNIGVPEINPVTNSMENPIPDTMMSQPNSNPNEMPPNNGVNIGVPEINPVTNSMANSISDTMMSQPNSNPNEMPPNNGVNIGVPEINPVQSTVSVENNQNINSQQNNPNMDLEYKICPRCQSRLRADAKTCFMCGSLVD